MFRSVLIKISREFLELKYSGYVLSEKLQEVWVESGHEMVSGNARP
jgi:hypothetical protein